MPLYDYECVHCGHAFELRQSFDADPHGVCPHCAGVSKRKFHAVPIIYKGSGFYTTDYKNDGRQSAPSKSVTEKEGEKKEKKDESAAPTTGSSEQKKEAAKEA